MKTVRFSQVVSKCGRPESYLVLTEPKKDHALQAAVKAQRVLTVMQSPVRTKTDWGEIGLHLGSGRQYLLFPKSLAAYADLTVVGIKYDLLKDAEAPRTRPKKQPPPKKAPAPPTTRKPDPSPEAKPAPFKSAPPKEKAESPEVTKLKHQVRRAMQVLEDGKQVAAFKLLREIVDD